uniref:C2H2-type domain-containing protein n=1 Tax=Globisporangium ultimum (strain ATCC 200006 / CBS 805.95 / DAOM BR144) TaxID=431595 RepID=K3WUX6_GLOUD
METPITTTGSFQNLLLADSNNQEAVVHTCPDPECGRQFSRKYTLTEHLKTHTGEKPHVCPVRTCNKRFSTSGNLARHKRLHGFIQPLECPVEGCVCTFPSDNKLEKHMKFHYGGPVHVCIVLGCGKTFSTTGNLNRHMKNQHPDVHNPNATPTAKRPAKKSPTSAGEWSPDSSGGEHHDDDEREMPKWSSAVAPHRTTELRSMEDSDVDGSDEDANDDDGGASTPDILDSLSSLLEDTDITNAQTDSSNAASVSGDLFAGETQTKSPNLFDDIIRFHVQDLGFEPAN